MGSVNAPESTLTVTYANRPRIAMLGAFPPQAQGIQEYCREVAETLATVVDVHAVGFRRMYPSFLFPGIRDAMDPAKPPLRGAGLETEHRLTWYNPGGWVFRAARVPCDLFHLQWWSLPLLPVSAVFSETMRLRRKPVVVTVHNVLPHEGGRGLSWAGRVLCRHAGRVVVHGEANRRQLMEHYALPEDRVAHIPMGFAGNTMPAPPRDEACTALALPAERCYLLSFGTIRPYKGVMDLIEAFASIERDWPGVDLVIAGKPWEDWAPYAERIKTLGLTRRVHCFLGYQPEDRVPLFYGAASLLVLPYTHFDAQSAVGAQALAYDLPMVVSSAGGLPEWVDHAPEWIVPPNNVPALAKALGAFLHAREERRKAFRAIARRVRKRLSRPAIAQAYLALYRSLIHERG